MHLSQCAQQHHSGTLLTPSKVLHTVTLNHSQMPTVCARVPVRVVGSVCAHAQIYRDALPDITAAIV